MKLRTLIHMLGLRPGLRKFSSAVEAFDLCDDGRVEFAQWKHPKSARVSIHQEDVNQLRAFLREGDAAIDIGAHTGDTALPMALAVGPTGTVLALEPNPHVFEVLERNAGLNAAKTNIEPLMFAAAEADQELEFQYSDAGYCNGGNQHGISQWVHGHAFKLNVQARNLEQYLRSERPDLLPRIRFIKTDAEGFDCVIIRSLTSLIKELRPVLKVEFYRHANVEQRCELYRTISHLGYKLHHVENERQYFGEVLHEGNLTKWQHFDAICIPQ